MAESVFHAGANPQDVPSGETPEEAAAREERDADIHAPEIGKAAPSIVFDDKGNPQPVSEEDVEADRVKDAAEERAERRKDGGDKR